jgi:glycosyltransferase involved in cell wall biosynthesis
MKDISVIIPVLNEEQNVGRLYELLREVLKHITLNYEIIFIDDGSIDRTYEVLKHINKIDNKVKVIKFRRNFGKAAALSVGFNETDSKFVVTMDGDLQDDPREIPRFIIKLNEGYDMISGWKIRRKDPLTKTIPSKFFNWLTTVITGVKVHDSNCGFKAYKGDVVKNIKLYGELHRYIPALAYWQGYKIGEVAVRHHPRKFGKSKYGVERLLRGFLDLITVKYITTYTKRPLHFFGNIGILSFILGFIIGFYLFIQWLMGVGIGKRPLLMLAILIMFVGIQFISIGLIGEMIVNSHDESYKTYNIKEKLD